MLQTSRPPLSSYWDTRNVGVCALGLVSCEVNSAVCKHNPPLYPSAPSSLPKPTYFLLYLHKTLPASLVVGQSVQGATLKGEEWAKILPQPSSPLTE